MRVECGEINTEFLSFFIHATFQEWIVLLCFFLFLSRVAFGVYVIVLIRIPFEDELIICTYMVVFIKYAVSFTHWNSIVW